jgi:hypothetical protein
MFQNDRKEISNIEGMENYKFYYVTLSGEIYSHKYKKLKKLRTHSVGKNRSLIQIVLY